jgi:autotransporter-associated beta strand protein
MKRSFLPIGILCSGLVLPLAAGDFFKASNGTTLNNTAAWTNAALPGGSDVAVWDTPYNQGTGLASTLGASANWQGIRIAAPLSVPRIRPSTGMILTLGSGGIDMSSATQNFLLDCNTQLGANQTWTVATGRTLTASVLDGSVGSTLTKAGDGILSLTGPVTFAGGLTIDGGKLLAAPASGTLVLAGPVAGSGVLEKSGVGALTLPAGNPGFSGTTRLMTGTLNVNHGNAFGSSAVAIEGGTLDNSSGAAVVLTGTAPMSWNGNFAFAGSNELDLGTSVVTVVGDRTLTVNAGLLKLGGAVTGNGSLTKGGAGTLELAGGAAVALNGKLAVGGGLLKVSGGTLECGLTSGGAELAGGVLELAGGSLKARSVTGTGGAGTLRFNGGALRPVNDSASFISGLSATQISSGGAILELDGWQVTLAQGLSRDPALGAAADGGLRVRDGFGGGYLTLGGVNSYTGPTVIESGTLELGTNGSIAASASIEVGELGTLDALAGMTLADGQTLLGSGTVQADLKVSAGSTVAPGGSMIGSLTMTRSLTVSGGLVMQVSKSGTVLNSDRIKGLERINQGGTLTVLASGSALAAGDKFTLFEALAYGGGFASLNLPALPAGLFWESAGLSVDGSIEVTNALPRPVFSPVPRRYLGPQVVTITGPAGSTIHYTTDGSDPLTSSTKVITASPAGGIIVPDNSVNFTIRAYASMTGVPSSQVTTGIYNIVDTGIWTADSSGAWSDPSRWLDDLIPEGAGITADFGQVDLTLNPTVTLDSPRSIGHLKFGSVAGANDWTLASSGGAVLTLEDGTAKPTIDVESATATVTAVLSGTAGYIKSGPGTLVTSLANASLAGGVVVREGDILIDKQNSLGTATVVLGDAGTGAAEVRVMQRGSDPWPPTDAFCTNNILVSAGPTGRLVLGRRNAGNYAALYRGTITLNNDLVLRHEGGDRLGIEGKITGTGNLIFEGTRINVDNVTNDFLGNVTISSGCLLQVNGNGIIPATSDITVNGILGFNTGSATTLAFGAFDGNGTVSVPFGGGAATITVGSLDRGGSFSGAIINNVSLVKTGSGTQVLSGASSTSGNTTVNGGMLLVNNTTGSGTGSGAVTANTGGTLGGTGSIGGAVTVNSGATLAPGNDGVGTLATGALTLAGTYQCQLDGANADRVAVAGNLNLAGATLAVSILNPPGAGPFIIATFTGIRTGTFAGVSPGYTVDYSTPNEVRLVASSGLSYASWVAGFGLNGPAAQADADPDFDGIANLVEFVLGGNPATVSDSALLPTVALVSNPGGTVPPGQYLRFTYRRTADSAYLNPGMQFNATLSGPWTTAVGAAGVVEVVTPGFFTTPVPADRVEVYVPRATHAVNGKLFGRLLVTSP